MAHTGHTETLEDLYMATPSVLSSRDILAGRERNSLCFW